MDTLAAANAVEHVQVGGDPVELLERSGPDVVLNAIVGFAGVRATLWALEHGVTSRSRTRRASSPPASSRSARDRREEGCFSRSTASTRRCNQCLEGRDPATVDGLVLTASGGPVSRPRRAELAEVTPADALAHPTWRMGAKITVDSATLVNKGLELIEAHWLFDCRTSASRSSSTRRRSSTGSCASATARCSPTSAIPTCASRSRTPSRIRSAPRRRSRSSTSRGSSSRSSRPTSTRSRCLALARAAGERAGPRRAPTTRPTRSPWRPSSPGASASSTSRRSSRRRSPPSTTGPARDLDDLIAADAEARRLAARGLRPA